MEVTIPIDYFSYKNGVVSFHAPSPVAVQQATLDVPPRERRSSTRKSHSDIETLTSALSVIRTHLSSLDEGIKRNIAAQVLSPPLSSDITNFRSAVTDGGPLPAFKTKDEHTPGAVMNMVKVCCVLERSLEALIEVLNMADAKSPEQVEAEEWKRKSDLVGVCLGMGREVQKVMGSAVEGVKGVVDFEGGG